LKSLPNIQPVVLLWLVSTTRKSLTVSIALFYHTPTRRYRIFSPLSFLRSSTVSLVSSISTFKNSGQRRYRCVSTLKTFNACESSLSHHLQCLIHSSRNLPTFPINTKSSPSSTTTYHPQIRQCRHAFPFGFSTTGSRSPSCMLMQGDLNPQHPRT
jgi:hypothetical protein